MYYQFYEWNHAFLSPARALNDAVRLYYKNPLNPMTHTEWGRQMVAAGDLFERMTRRYGKPDFGIDSVVVDGVDVPVIEEVVWSRPFCNLLHFKRMRPVGAPRQPAIVIVAPMSGHYSSLLRGTVAALLQTNDVYITDWVDARMVPLAAGSFDLEDYVDYIIEITAFMRGDLHMVAVCQPAVPVFAATALMEARGDETLPKSITLMGGPIDTRQNPTEVNEYAAKHDLDWFESNVVMTVPFPHPGVMRKVYPGFLQLTGFMTMNLDRHMSAHYDYFDDLVKGDGDSAEKHREFYDEYLSVMDLTAEFYLQTVDTVFLKQSLPNGTMVHRGTPVDPSQITRTPIFTVEGENDDISGIGQTKAAHTLTPNLPAERHAHYEQEGVGHYGVFNGSRFRREIAPRISEFAATWDGAVDGAAKPAPAAAAEDETPIPDAIETGAVTPAAETLTPAALTETADTTLPAGPVDAAEPAVETMAAADDAVAEATAAADPIEDVAEAATETALETIATTTDSALALTEDEAEAAVTMAEEAAEAAEAELAEDAADAVSFGEVAMSSNRRGRGNRKKARHQSPTTH
ncbi:polyhydroxyalkanoate depolymerase [Acuticoccus sp. MNP-M23]|uniref:polyhydroxyalkanoate depolymerase n=1 Tax=Acuticoccus sp. MNP-M23 TaxID=3072793 RepID=UPI0028161DE3|nr:polyhydroxyalkanoate depolymerase [Acuticoccus sp. MNP-M23]WMS41126.1 polyhydroxyalkanoate depolymerase [Acuticoccus sp. MNP-M23]